MPLHYCELSKRSETSLGEGAAWLANEIALAWIHERVPRDSAPLPDLWFSIFPEVCLVPFIKCCIKTSL
uniref:Uncharacterized protein n=1 Tax=Ascaris lumbricoides TaxID=6252 RepID=A0A0M3HEZ1_ASCLU